MTPEEKKLHVEKSQMSKHLHAELQAVLQFADPKRYGAHWHENEEYSPEKRDEMRRLSTRKAYAYINQGAKLDTYYSDKKMPLNLAMEICLVTGDPTIFNEMVKRAVNPVKINQQQDFEYAFIKAMTDEIPEPKKLDTLLRLLEDTKNGKKLLGNTWTRIVRRFINDYAQYHALPAALKTFQNHGYDIKGKVSEKVLATVIREFERNLRWCNDLSPEYEPARQLKPVLEEMLEHYKAPKPAAAPAPAGASPAPQVAGSTLDASAVERLAQPEGRGIGGGYVPRKGLGSDT